MIPRKVLWLIALLFAHTVQAQPDFTYTAMLEANALRQSEVVASGISWQCKGPVCTTVGPWPTPGVGACAALAQIVGPLRSYGHPKLQLTAEQLIECNRAAAAVQPVSRPATRVPMVAQRTLPRDMAVERVE